MAMAESFLQATVEATRDVFEPMLTDPIPLEYIAQPGREGEATAVEPCVDRLADYEIHVPKHGKGAGRYGPGSLTPPIGKLIGSKKIAGLDTAQEARLRSAIVHAVAVGYVGMTAMEAGGENIGPRTNVDPAQMWAAWVVRLVGDSLEMAGVPENVQSGIRNMAGGPFTEELRAMDLFPRVRKRMRFQLVGQWYGQAGMVLRLIQVTGMGLDEDSPDLLQLTNTWAFERRD